MSEPSEELRIGIEMRESYTFSADRIRSFAAEFGDTNPQHGDEDELAESRFHSLIASASHTSAVLLASSAGWMHRFGPSVGLGFEFRYKQPVLADEPLELRWTVIKLREAPCMGGRIATVRGGLFDAQGRCLVLAEGKALVESRG